MDGWKENQAGCGMSILKIVRGKKLEMFHDDDDVISSSNERKYNFIFSLLLRS